MVCWRMRRRRFPLFISQDGAPPHRATRDVACSHPAQVAPLSCASRCLAAPGCGDCGTCCLGGAGNSMKLALLHFSPRHTAVSHACCAAAACKWSLVCACDAVTDALGGAQVTYLSHQQRARPMVADSSKRAAYYRIAEHYRFVLHTLFDCFRYPRVIILEVDLHSYMFCGMRACLHHQDRHHAAASARSNSHADLLIPCGSQQLRRVAYAKAVEMPGHKVATKH